MKGKKLTLNNFSKKKDGIYKLQKDGFLSIIEIKNKKINYLINQMEI
jgi:hypothetical protein